MPSVFIIDIEKDSNCNHVIIDTDCVPIGYSHTWVTECPYPVSSFSGLEGRFDPCNSWCLAPID